ncbi:hypothetical protein [Myxococcus landrumensis]|uniref:Lipoprotein n=1 Tax=Myxococcus landrumensis TaxID=2813577 RepID=A0ABX7N0S2_9BACT|nr:hypothetical protein [Myxococcus landrumus]QSQ12296.1 hypothetical protein JY572_28560 [Myxococcus landrumus]
MNRYGWMVLFLVGCGSQHHGARVHERGMGPSRDYRSGEGFQATRWGMGREEIRGLYPSVRETPRGDLVVETEIDERPVRVFFLFADGQLGSVFVRFATPEDLQKDHRSMVKLLASKYGRPAQDGISRRVNRYRDSIDLAGVLTKEVPLEVAGTSSGSMPEVAGGALTAVVRPEDSEEMARTLEAWPGDAVPVQETPQTTEGAPPVVSALESPGQVEEGEPEVLFSPHGYVKVATWKEREMAIQLLGYSAPRGALLTLHYESHTYSRAIRNALNPLLAELREEQGSEF